MDSQIYKGAKVKYRGNDEQSLSNKGVVADYLPNNRVFVKWYSGRTSSTPINQLELLSQKTNI